VGIIYRTFADLRITFTDLTSSNSSIDAIYTETPLTAVMAQYKAEVKTMIVVYSAPYYPRTFTTNINAQTFTVKINGALADIDVSGKMDTLKAKWNLTNSTTSTDLGRGKAVLGHLSIKINQTYHKQQASTDYNQYATPPTTTQLCFQF